MLYNCPSLEFYNAQDRHSSVFAEYFEIVKQSKVVVALAISFILQFTSTASSGSAEAGTMDFSWNDNQSIELNRTFYEDQTNSDLRSFAIDAVTQSDEFYSKQVSLERNVKGSWEYVTANYFFYNRPEPGLKATFYGIDPICGIRTWCSGKYRYRFVFGDTVLKEFAVTFIPRRSNLKIKLTTDKEQAWGTMHSLKVTTTPKVSLNCTVERDYENIGKLQVKNGSGSLKFRALTQQKPSSGRKVVTLYTVCKSAKYYGVSELSFALFVP